MDMEIDSETPPSSPIMGYGVTRCAGNSSLLDIDDEGCYFTCKGPVRGCDEDFSLKGMIVNGEVVQIMKILMKNNMNETTSSEERFENFNGKFFDFPFVPNEDTLKIFILICRKSIAALENLASPVQLPSSSSHLTDNAGSDDYENDYLRPWELRKEVSIFLNAVLKGLHLIKDLDYLKPMELFRPLMNSIEKIENWNNCLKTHGGSVDGNKCTSAYYHYFHLQLQLRWFFVAMGSLNPVVIEWAMSDLAYLAMYRFTSERRAGVNILKIDGFNCYCVKELWTMLRIVIDKLKPQGRDFWDFVVNAVKIDEKTDDYALYQLWFITCLAPLGNYGVTGQTLIQPGYYSSNCYPFVVELLKNSASDAYQLDQMMQIAQKLPAFWGTDEKLGAAIWESWANRLDKNVSVQEHMYWKTCEKWMGLINSLTSEEIDSYDEVDNSNCFLIFVKLFANLAKHCNEQKRLNKLLMPLYIKMTTGKVLALNELGLIRLLTLQLSICSSVSPDLMSGAYKWFSNSKELYEGLFDRKKFGIVKTLLTAHTSALLILLDRRISISATNSYVSYMDPIAQLIMRDAQLGPGARELVMCYIELLSWLPKYSGDSDLGQETLVSPNISVWCSNATADYLSRTLKVLNELLQWQLTAQSVPKLAETVYIVAKELASSLLSRPRAPLTENDMEILAQLGVSFTQYSRNRGEQAKTIFSSFALDAQSNVAVSRLYIESVFQLDPPIGISYTDLSQAWVRLICHGIVPPYKMTRQVLLSDSAALSDNPLVLAKLYCEFVNSQEDWDRAKVEIMLSPLDKVCERISRFPSENLKIVKPVVSSCVMMLQCIEFSKIYISMLPSIAKRLIVFILQLPCNDATSQIVANYLSQLLKAIIGYPKWVTDDYLKSRVVQIITLAFTAYTKDAYLASFQYHPCYKILKLAMDENNIPLLHLLSELQAVASDAKLGKHREYLKTLIHVAKQPTLISALVYSLGTMLKIVRHSGNDADAVLCAEIVSKVFEQDVIPGDQVDEIKSIIYNEMSSRMTMHWRKYFKLLRSVVKSMSPKSGTIKCNFRTHVLETIKDLVHICESERGYGTNESVRNELRYLEADASS